MPENSLQPADGDFPSQEPEPRQPQLENIPETSRPAPEVEPVQPAAASAEKNPPAIQPAEPIRSSEENVEDAGGLKQAEREHMPAWLREQIIDDVVHSSLDPEHQPASEPQSEVERLRNELARSQSEAANYRQQLQYRDTSRTSYASYTPERTRGGCLTAWLVFQAIGVALGGIGLCVLMSQSGGAGEAGTLAALIGGALLVVTAISIYGVWNLRKWGFYMQLVIYLLGIGGSLLSICTLSSSGTGTASGAIGELIGSIIGLIIFSLLVQNRWEMFE